MREDLKHNRMAILIHLAVGFAIGWVSPLLGRALYAVGLGIMIAVILWYLTERVFGKKGFTWWIGNGLFVYLFVWIDFWIFLVNYF